MGYILVNPKLSTSSINSNKRISNEAAEDIWSQLSTNIKNYTPKFYFSIQNINNSKLSHFIIQESLEKNRVKYALKQFNGKKIDDTQLLNLLKQDGGKHKHKHRYEDDDNSSSSSSSSSKEMVFTFPAGKTQKDLMTLTYYPTIYGVPNVLLPTFTTSFAPFVNIGLLPNVLILNP